ncbi:unnamed protein product [Soboliphyme baturini]|uniref:AP_endonuc_2 domain-containing protein n=1 Tax=Soboliphyme baturini TaxID=241478 RepID=A0A183I9J3_9BILA|nr:unnamed protein product [Soboliphyme baturini]
MSCQGYTVGGDFNEIRKIIDMVADKTRIGVCLDTCHMFAAGFDVKTAMGYEKAMNEFGKIIGWNYLKGVHLNDSRGDRGCHLDRHENIGKGKIGLEGFRNFMNDVRFDDVPMVLETPFIDYTKEIESLYKLL